MSPSGSKTPPDPDHVSGRVVADGVGRAFRETIPAEDNGLGQVGEAVLIGLLDEADRDEDRHRTLMRFPLWWRNFIRKTDVVRLDTIDELVNERLERRVIRRFLRRLKHALIAAVVGSFVAAHWFSDQVAWVVERLPDLEALVRLFTRGKS